MGTAENEILPPASDIESERTAYWSGVLYVSDSEICENGETNPSHEDSFNADDYLFDEQHALRTPCVQLWKYWKWGVFHKTPSDRWWKLILCIRHFHTAVLSANCEVRRESESLLYTCAKKVMLDQKWTILALMHVPQLPAKDRCSIITNTIRN